MKLPFYEGLFNPETKVTVIAITFDRKKLNTKAGSSCPSRSRSRVFHFRSFISTFIVVFPCPFHCPFIPFHSIHPPFHYFFLHPFMDHFLLCPLRPWDSWFLPLHTVPYSLNLVLITSLNVMLPFPDFSDSYSDCFSFLPPSMKQVKHLERKTLNRFSPASVDGFIGIAREFTHWWSFLLSLVHTGWWKLQQ